MSDSDHENPIEVQNELAYDIAPEPLVAAVKVVLKQHQRDDAELQIVLQDNDHVQHLNQQYRGVDAPTDVLSFPADPLPPEFGEPDYLGDLVIAVPYSREQAERLGQSFSDTLILLVVHGTLHLLGYDHDTAQNRATMWEHQAAALHELGIDTRIVPALEEFDHGE